MFPAFARYRIFPAFRTLVSIFVAETTHARRMRHRHPCSTYATSDLEHELVSLSPAAHLEQRTLLPSHLIALFVPVHIGASNEQTSTP
jgi:hypothetical protein